MRWLSEEEIGMVSGGESGITTYIVTAPAPQSPSGGGTVSHLGHDPLMTDALLSPTSSYQPSDIECFLFAYGQLGEALEQAWEGRDLNGDGDTFDEKAWMTATLITVFGSASVGSWTGGALSIAALVLAYNDGVDKGYIAPIPGCNGALAA